jgi:hypothetical protein
MGLNSDETLYGKSLGSNQAAFVVDFLTIVSGFQVPNPITIYCSGGISDNYFGQQSSRDNNVLQWRYC